VLAALISSLVIAAAPGAPRVTIDMRDADVHNVLRLLADLGKVNIVVADGVQGKLTVRLRAVPWRAALDAVLAQKKLGMTRSGDVILVETLEAMTARASAEARRGEVAERLGEPVTVVIPLSYAKAADLVKIVRGLLSPRGRVEADARTNSLIVTDVPRRVRRVQHTFAK